MTPSPLVKCKPYFKLRRLTPQFRIFNLLVYISFRAVMAAVTGLILSFILGILVGFLELIVSVLQAYVFTLLTATYIQGSLAAEH